MFVTDVVFRGGGATISFSDGSIGEAVVSGVGGVPRVVGLSSAQMSAWVAYRRDFDDSLGVVLPLSATGDNNRRLIRSVDDLPDLVGGRYVLDADTVYCFSGTVTIAYPLVMSVGTVITGVLGNSTIVYTGVVAAVIADRVGTTVIHFVNIVAPFGAAVDLIGELTYESMLFFVGFVGCAYFGEVSGFNVSSFKSCYFLIRV